MIQLEIGQTIIVRNKQLVCLEIESHNDVCNYNVGSCDAIGSCSLLACCKEERGDGKQVYFKALPKTIKGSTTLIEIPIGGTFTIKGVRYRAELVESRENHIFKCGQCAFYSTPTEDTCSLLQCIAIFRHDAQEIVFVKDGEE